jgi:hypothetical protein
MATKLLKPSSKVVETYEMLKSGKSVTVDSMVAALGCKPGTLMVHICQMRGHFDAVIETERDGRKVVSYLLSNPDEVAPHMLKTSIKVAKTPKAAKTPKVKATKTKTVVSRKAAKDDEFDVPTLDADLDITEVSDAELADLRNQLGLA